MAKPRKPTRSDGAAAAAYASDLIRADLATGRLDGPLYDALYHLAWRLYLESGQDPNLWED